MELDMLVPVFESVVDEDGQTYTELTDTTDTVRNVLEAKLLVMAERIREEK